MNGDDNESLGEAVSPLSLAFVVFGLHEFDFELGRCILASVFVRAGILLDINEAATRAALRRSATRGLMRSWRRGRSVTYELTESGRSLLRQGRARLFDPRALDHSVETWTVLVFLESPPLRNDRYELGTRLSWAGFGRLLPSVWITPGQVELAELLGGILPPEQRPVVLEAAIVDATNVAAIVARAWRPDVVRAAHEKFLSRWDGWTERPGEELPQLIALLEDWGALLRTDPGLPASCLPVDWPAGRSLKLFTRVRAATWQPARDQLSSFVRAAG